MLQPVKLQYKNVAVHSKVWCNGKNESTLSSSRIFIKVVIAETFEQIFFEKALLFYFDQ